MLLRTRGAGSLPSLCVGFADMVGFTVLSQQLSEDELAVVVSRFEEVAHYTVTGAGGRLVKMIGDEAMFVAESPLAAARIALGLAEAYADDELLSDVRVGLAEGPVLVQDGDYYGPVVNLAHAVVGLADPGSVLLSDDFHAALLHELHPAGRSAAAPPPPPSAPAAAPSAGDVQGEFAFRAVRPRIIKDLGRVQLWVLYRQGTRPTFVGQRIGRGWERLAEVLREIEDLRDRGERLLTEGLRAAASSGSGDADGGDAEGTELERPVEGSDGAAAEVDEPT
jgi:hypothetical protein